MACTFSIGEPLLDCSSPNQTAAAYSDNRRCVTGCEKMMKRSEADPEISGSFNQA